MSFSTIVSEREYLTDSTLVPGQSSSSFSSTTTTFTSFSSSCSGSSNTSNLLFGEIDSGNTSFSTTTSHCTIPNTTCPPFLQFWLNDTCRTTLTSFLPPSSLKSLRLVCHDFSDRLAPCLFSTLRIRFSAGVFSRSSKLVALRRVGQHVKNVVFAFKRDMDTMLLPLIDPWSGEERTIVWDPRARELKERFGGEEVLELVRRQYSPVFFAGTNVGGFERILGCLGLVEGVGVVCEEEIGLRGGNGSGGSRMDVVDYALMSLRIAVEKSHTPSLKSLRMEGRLKDLLQFSPVSGLGANPGSMRRWRGIKDLEIVLTVDAGCGGQKIKMLHNYLRNFTGLEELSFAWKGRRGGCPLPMPMAGPKDTTLHPALRSTIPTLATMFPRLQALKVKNAGLRAQWVHAMLEAHRLTLQELELENVVLKGSWDDALRDLGKGVEVKSHRCVVEEVGDVPIMLGSALAADTRSNKTSNGIGGVGRNNNGRIEEGEEEKRKRMQGEVRRMLMTEEEVRMDVQVQGQTKEKKKKGREKGWLQKTCAGVFGWRIRG